jgi:drug/metabolite transporter (DMT)-like permease
MMRPDRPAALHRPPPRDLALMSIAVCAISTSGPLIAATAAAGLVIAFWRNALACGLLVPWTLLRARAELRRLSGRERRLMLLAGVMLAGHFATWVPAVRLTSVASATALVATQPIWAALVARRLGQHVPRLAWVGIGVAVVGAVTVTGVDVTVSARAAAGDLLALLGAVFAAGYVTAGGTVRRSVTTTVYTTSCYAVAGLLLLAVCLASGLNLASYPANVWAKLAAMTVGPQLLGHSVLNRVLRTTSPTVVSLTILLEVPGASLIAALWLHQHPRAGVIPGLVLLLVGIAVVIGGRPGAEAALPAE